MAIATLLTLIDDIASSLDDVAAMTKIASKKTAGVLGDDLALNAKQVSGLEASRELPVVWAVAKGSLVNKAVLIPFALGISYWLPSLIAPLMVLGGVYLCFEGMEKIFHKFLAWLKPQSGDLGKDQSSLNEKEKIKGAIRTDFVLSAEVVVIALGTAASLPFSERFLVLVAIGILMTVGVYGLVAVLIKLDDVGLYFAGSSQPWTKSMGRSILWACPGLMRILGVGGTIAMFLVGGGIISHGLVHWIPIPQGSWFFATAIDLGVGLFSGICAVAAYELVVLGAGFLRKG